MLFENLRSKLVETRDVEDDCAAVIIEHFIVDSDDAFELELAEFVQGRGGDL